MEKCIEIGAFHTSNFLVILRTKSKKFIYVPDSS